MLKLSDNYDPDTAKANDDKVLARIEDGDAAALVAKLRTYEGRQKEIQAELKNLRPIPRLAPKVRDDRLGEWQRNLRGSTTQARAVLQRVIRGRITFMPLANGYEFTAPTRFDGLFAGIVIPGLDPEHGQRKGLEHLGPEDTFDGDYGRLLENAISRKGGRALQVSNLRPPA